MKIVTRTSIYNVAAHSILCFFNYGFFFLCLIEFFITELTNNKRDSVVNRRVLVSFIK